jgi:hypothetical protein
VPMAISRPFIAFAASTRVNASRLNQVRHFFTAVCRRIPKMI